MFNSLGEKLKKIDVYRSTQDDFKIKTLSGAIISILSITIMIILFSNELMAAFRIEENEKLVVDNTLDQPLDISFDVVFYHVPCFLLTVGARDAIGDDRKDINTDMYKQSLDVNGNPIGERQKDELVHSAATKEELLSENKNSTCLPCYGAEDVISPDVNGKKCCNTCDVLLDAYSKKMWSTDKLFNTVDICKDYDRLKNWKEGVEKGCHINGTIHVNKVGGHFFLAPSKAYSLLRSNNLDWNSMQTVYNISHHINEVKFGNGFYGNNYSISNRTFIMSQNTGMYQYFVKVVPTTLLHSGHEVDQTYQISETHHFREMTDKATYLFPGLFFIYDISPLRSLVSYDRQPAGVFMTSVCAILGGVFTIMGLLDSIVYNLQKKMNKNSNVLDSTKTPFIPNAKKD